MDEKLEQVVKKHELTMAIRLRDEYAAWWEVLLRELALDQSRLLKECIALRMAVHFAQKKGRRCTIEDDEGQDVNLVDFFKLRKPQDDVF